MRKLKPADIINKTVPTPIHIDLLSFNVNEQEIAEGGQQFYEKFADEDGDFHPCFEDFYFNRYEEASAGEEALPSVKSESTKENKSLGLPQSPSSKKDSLRKINGYKSVSREKPQKLLVDISKAHHHHPVSEIHRDKPPKKLKKQKTRKQLNLVERSKPREDKSLHRSTLEKHKSPLRSKETGRSGGLNRVKSTAALLSAAKRNK